MALCAGSAGDSPLYSAYSFRHTCWLFGESAVRLSALDKVACRPGGLGLCPLTPCHAVSTHTHAHTHAHTADDRVLSWGPEGAPRIALCGGCVRDTACGLGVGLEWGLGLVLEQGLLGGSGVGVGVGYDG